MVKDIAIIVFTYGRLDHTMITLENLSKNIGFNNYSTIIFSDGPKIGHEEKVKSVREYLRKFKSGKPNVTVIERDSNYGLERSIIEGVTEILNKYEGVIVIEDDIRTSPKFLEYMNKLLIEYKDKKDIGCISGFNHQKNLMKIPRSYKYDIYFAPRTNSWGWATWRDRWGNIDWDIKDIEKFINNKRLQKEFNLGGNDLSRMLINQVKRGIDTWDIQWCYHNFKYKRLTIYPVVSYVENIGMDGTGVHCGKVSAFKNDSLNKKGIKSIPLEMILDKEILKNFTKAQSLTLKMYYELVVGRTSKIIKTFINR